MAEGENCAYGPTLKNTVLTINRPKNFINLSQILEENSATATPPTNNRSKYILKKQSNFMGIFIVWRIHEIFYQF